MRPLLIFVGNLSNLETDRFEDFRKESPISLENLLLAPGFSPPPTSLAQERY
jgi:hypothetical protein